MDTGIEVREVDRIEEKENLRTPPRREKDLDKKTPNRDPHEDEKGIR